ncbi:MAG: hypothetical protein BMS9Abin23_0945 [Thermodesulfobacteriota bacterium]|nr:MAG: hypothetical protein BMS9Abin23_0945 [Thermodesulfobacteriota bacterium]
MPRRPPLDDLTQKLFEELAETLDIEKSIKKLKITAEEAREIFRAFTPPRGKKKADGFYEAYVDGASRGNPGESGAGAVIRDPSGNVAKRLKRYLGTGTNNSAEYKAMIMALDAARSMGVSRIRVFADSELMVKQLNGEYSVRSPNLKPLYEEARALLDGFTEYRIRHVPREKNKTADSLANEAIDGHR